MLAALAATLPGCHNQNPYGIWGPSRIPPPAQAKALPYYPSATSHGHSEAVPRSASNNSAGSVGDLSPRLANLDRATTSGHDRTEGKPITSNTSPDQGGAGSYEAPADSTPIRIEPEDRQPIRIVENPRQPVQTARTGAVRQPDRTPSNSGAQGAAPLPGMPPDSQATPPHGSIPRQPENSAKGAYVPRKAASAAVATSGAVPAQKSRQSKVIPKGDLGLRERSSTAERRRFDPAVRPASAENPDTEPQYGTSVWSASPGGWKSR